MNSSSHAHPSGSPSPDALLHRMERVRAMAGQLVRQAADQDDLVQEAVTRALARPREVEGDPAPWIQRVVKNLAIDRQRAASRRRTHESSAAEARVRQDRAVQESTADSIARAEQQRDLVDAVLELDDPYRAVIVQRFFDGLPPREIAKLRGVPVATVKKQQERGMAMLRKKLEARYGGDGAWAVALLPILPKSVLVSLGTGSTAATVVGAWGRSLASAFTGSTAAWGIAAAALALGVGLAALRGSRDTEGVEELRDRGEATPIAAAGSRSQPPALLPPAETGRSVPRGTAAGAAPADLAPTWTFTGTFVDASGAPVDGVTARCRVGDVEGSPSPAAGDGTVIASIRAPLDPGMVAVAEAEGFAPATFRFPSGGDDAGAPPAVSCDVGVQTLFREAELTVGVVDERGNALLGWEMSYFHYGGGKRLDWGRAAADPISGRAAFSGLPATDVEVIAKHPSGVSIHHPRRYLDPGGANAIELVHLGPDPSRRIGVELAWPATVAPGDGEALELFLDSGEETIAVADVRPGQSACAFEDVDPGAYVVSVRDPRYEAQSVAASRGASTHMALTGNARMRLNVTDVDGRRVTDYVLALGSEAGRTHRMPAPPDGLLEGLVPGQAFALRLTAPDGREAALRVAPLLARETRILGLTLGDGVRDVTVRVVRAGDVPVTGADVALFDRAIPPGSPLEPVALALLDAADDGRVAEGLRLVARGTTDSRGELHLTVAAHELSGAMAALAVENSHGFAPVEDGEASVELSPLGAARVELRGLPATWTAANAEATGLPEGMALTLTSPKSVARGRAPFGPGIVLEPSGDGSFSTSRAPVGPGVVWLSFSDFNHTGRGTTLGGITGPVGYPLGTVHIGASEVVPLEADVTGRWPGSLEILARHGGRPLTDAVVELEPAGSHAHLPYPPRPGASVSRILTRLTDGRGRARFDRVPVGHWHIRVRDSEWQWVSDCGEVEVGSASHGLESLTVPIAEGEVTLIDAATGAPLRDRTVRVEMAPRRRVERSTDGEGRLRLRLGPGRYPVLSNESGTRARAKLEWGVDGPVRATLRLEAYEPE